MTIQDLPYRFQQLSDKIELTYYRRKSDQNPNFRVSKQQVRSFRMLAESKAINIYIRAGRPKV